MTLDEARERISDVFRQIDERDPGEVFVALMQAIEDLSDNHYLPKKVFLNQVHGQVGQMLEVARGGSGAGEGG